MNRTSLSVIALAVGAVLIIGLYNVYKPQTKGLVDRVFQKASSRLVTTKLSFVCNGKTVGTQSVQPYSSVRRNDMKVPFGYTYAGSNNNIRTDTGEHKINVKPAVKETFQGISYLSNGCGRIDIVSNIPNIGDKWPFWMPSYGRNLWGAVPKDLGEANTVKVDSDVDATSSSLCGLFANNVNLKSVDLGNNFHTNHERLFMRIFENDPNLEYVNLGSHFNMGEITPYYQDGMNKPGDMNMFYNDKKLKTVHGDVPNDVWREFNHRFSLEPHTDE